MIYLSFLCEPNDNSFGDFVQVLCESLPILGNIICEVPQWFCEGFMRVPQGFCEGY